MKSGMFDSITVLPARDLPGGLARLGGAGGAAAAGRGCGRASRRDGARQRARH